MGGDRKHVGICSKSDSFNRALRLMLADYDVEVSSEPDKLATTSDLLVWRVDGGTPHVRLTDIASEVPTLLLGPSDHLVTAVDAGCRGFLASDASLEEIKEASDTILDGGAVIPPDLLGTLLQHIVQQRRRLRALRDDFDVLTDREWEVFELAANGLRKEEIGERLYISPATARTHLQRVYRKLGVHSQAELMALAVNDGRLPLTEEANE